MTIEQAPGQITVAQGACGQAGIGKSIQITMGEQSVTLVHTLTNGGTAPLEVAPWAITQLPVGGTAIIPLRRDAADPHQLQPSTSLVLWPYTGAADNPFLIENHLVILESKRVEPTKAGTPLHRGWLAYLKDGLVFVKRAIHQAGERYLDLDASGQCYSCADFLELETLGPQVRLDPGDATTHTETWELYKVDPDTPPDQVPTLLDLDGGNVT